MKQMLITKKNAADWAGNYSKLARELSISRQAVRNWGIYVPQSSAWKLHILSKYKIGRIIECEHEINENSVPKTDL